MFQISFYEIYNEHVYDLLQKTKENLMVIEDPEKGNIVYDLT